MQDYTLLRSGKPPITFTGTQLSQATDAAFGKQHTHSLTLFQTTGGKYILYIDYQYRTQREQKRPKPPYMDAFILETPEQIKATLEAHKKNLDKIAFLPSVGALNWQERTVQVLNEIRADFENQVGQILDHHIFAEEVQ